MKTAQARGTAVPPTERSPLSACVWENKADTDASDVLKHILHITQSSLSVPCIMSPFLFSDEEIQLIPSREISSVCYYYSEGSLLVWSQVKLMIGAMSTLRTGNSIIPSAAQDRWHSSHKRFPPFEATPWLLCVITGYLCCQAKKGLFLGKLPCKKDQLRVIWTRLCCTV